MTKVHVDFHRVPDSQTEIHARLLNWALYVQPKGWRPAAPMWRFTKSSSRMWHQPGPRIVINEGDADLIEHAVRALPALHRGVIRWYYVEPVSPAKASRRWGVSYALLAQLVIDARTLIALNSTPVITHNQYATT